MKFIHIWSLFLSVTLSLWSKSEYKSFQVRFLSTIYKNLSVCCFEEHTTNLKSPFPDGSKFKIKIIPAVF